MRRDSGERGTVTLFVLGLCVALLFLAGLSLDLWRAVAVRRELSAMADASATAGANGVDEAALRAGELHLDPDRARAFAVQTLDQYGRTSSLDDVQVEIVGDQVTVTLHDHVEFSLLGIFMADEKFEVEVHASAEPEERP
jgi:Flp pilus assembly protein TadG